LSDIKVLDLSRVLASLYYKMISEDLVLR